MIHSTVVAHGAGHRVGARSNEPLDGEPHEDFLDRKARRNASPLGQDGEIAADADVRTVDGETLQGGLGPWLEVRVVAVVVQANVDPTKAAQTDAPFLVEQGAELVLPREVI